MHNPENHQLYETIVCTGSEVDVSFCQEWQVFTYRGSDITDGQHLANEVYFNTDWTQEGLYNKVLLRDCIFLSEPSQVITNHGVAWCCLSTQRQYSIE